MGLTLNLAYENDRAPERHTRELETAIYRIVQESLTNASKHGDAEQAVVTVEEDESVVRVTIQDDGRGFDTAGADSPA